MPPPKQHNSDPPPLSPWRALAHVGFRWYLAAQTLSVLGSWTQQVALNWLVYRVTDSPGLLGITAFATMAPQLVVGPIAGAWIDRHTVGKLATVVQILLFLQAASLAWLTWTENIGPGILVAMSVVMGVLASADIPLRQALIGRLFENSPDLPSALALNSMVLNLGRFLGPPLAGMLIGMGSEATCFFLNALTYIGPMLVLARIGQGMSPVARGNVRHLLIEGIRHGLSDAPIRTLLMAMTVLNLTASAAIVLLPAVARDVLAGDAGTLGLISAATGLGAIFATIDLGRRGHSGRVVDATCAGLAIGTVALLLLALSERLPMTLIALLLLGYGSSIANVGIGTLVQSLAPPALRGRLIALLVATRFGFDAIGSLLAGLAAGRVGLAATLVAQGALLALACAGLLRQSRMLKASARTVGAATHS